MMCTSFVDGLSEEELSAYAGRWIAYVGTRIIGQGDTPQQALAAAKSARFKDVPQVIYIPVSFPDSFFEQIKPVVQALPPGVNVYLIGGAVRDLLLGKATHDLDFTLAGDVFHISRKIADKIGAAFYPLDEERNTARLVLHKADGSRVTYDFAAFRGLDLEKDLRSRDFTINAMAIDIRQPTGLLDPLLGAADLRAHTLRACSPTAISDDPVRILRAVRLAAAYHLHILPETLSQMRQAAPQLAYISTERVRDELFRILAGPRPATSLRALDMLGVFSVTLPELTQLKGLEQSPPHILDAWRHTLDVAQKLEVITNALSPQFNPDEAADYFIGLAVLKLGKFRQQIGKHLEMMLNPDRSVKSLLFFAALFHDIGKPETRQRDEKGIIHFLGHEKTGEQIAGDRAQALHLSNSEVERTRLIIRGHLRPRQLSNTTHLPTRKAIYHFFRDTGAAGVDICLLSLADLLGTYGAGLPGDLWIQQLEVVRLLLEAWFEKPEESISPPALLNGHDLMSELHLEAGPVVGQLISAIREGQATGQIHTRQEALDLSKGLLSRL
jgi:tRNA nucleotidyltransferase/poly(A) polymerase